MPAVAAAENTAELPGIPEPEDKAAAVLAGKQLRGLPEQPIPAVVEAVRESPTTPAGTVEQVL
jgi:hypothetical protein